VKCDDKEPSERASIAGRCLSEGIPVRGQFLRISTVVVEMRTTNRQQRFEEVVVLSNVDQFHMPTSADYGMVVSINQGDWSRPTRKTWDANRMTSFAILSNVLFLTLLLILYTSCVLL